MPSAFAGLTAGFLLLAACADPRSAAPMPPPSPRQAAVESWISARAAYDAALAVAANYRIDCARKPPRSRSRCMEVVERLREIDSVAEETMELGDTALAEGDEALALDAADALDRLRRRVEADLLAEPPAEPPAEPRRGTP